MTLVLFLVGLMVAAVWGRWLMRPSRRPLDAPPATDVSALAWACGGPSRTMQVWWSSLQAMGVLSRPATAKASDGFSVHRQAFHSQDPWLQKAYDNLPIADTVSWSGVSWAWASVLKELEQDLKHRHVLASESYRYSRRVMGVLVATMFAFLTVLCVFHAGPWAVALGWTAMLLVPGLFMPLPRLTDEAHRWRQKRAEAASVARRAPQSDTIGLAVAVGGLAVLAGTPFAAYAATPGASSSGGGCGSSMMGSGCGSTSSAIAASSSGFSAGGDFSTGGGFGGGEGASGGGDGGGSGCGGGGCGGGGGCS